MVFLVKKVKVSVHKKRRIQGSPKFPKKRLKSRKIWPWGGTTQIRLCKTSLQRHSITALRHVIQKTHCEDVGCFIFKSVKHFIYQSHPIGRGPDFVRGAFNIYGQSPLVAHFLRMRRLETDAGINFRVQRTQMQNLPPLDTPTYRDLMRDSYKHVQEIEKKYERSDFLVSVMKFQICVFTYCNWACMYTFIPKNVLYCHFLYFVFLALPKRKRKTKQLLSRSWKRIKRSTRSEKQLY